MAKDWRTLKLEILAETKQFVTDMKKGEDTVESFGDKATKMGKVAAAAFAAAAAAAAAYAGKLAIEGVKAAIEDEAAQKRLALALQNVTGATEAQIAAVEEQISKTALATGVADDKLRPALQRLATATGSVSESQKLLTLALDISAATGKDVETVSNALGKAYEGNTASLARLGIGLSAAEIKTMGLQGAVTQLGQTFGGAAATQANTFEGQIARLRVGFDEAKEAIGAQLLPVIQRLLDYVVNVLIPKFQEAKRAAIDPIVQAFKNNEAALRDLWSFIKTYLVPIFETALVGAIKSVGATIAGIINIIGTVTSKVKELANDVIDAVNKIIRAYNSIPILPNVSTIPNISTTTTSRTGSVPTASLPFGGASIIPSSSGSANVTPSTPTTTVVTPVTSAPKVTTTPSVPIGSSTAISVGSNFNPGSFRMGEERSMAGVTINVNAPSAIDEEGFTRAVVSALNNSNSRGTGGGSGLFGIRNEL
jgi:citrate lyase beta subunit